MPNPLTQDIDTAWETINDQRSEASENIEEVEDLKFTGRLDGIHYWLKSYHEAVEAGDTHEMTRLLGWLDDMKDIACELKEFTSELQI